MAATNPLLEAVLDFLSQGRQFTAIRPEESSASNHKVAFQFSDGTEDIRTFQCDRSTFKEWWHHTSGYLSYARSAADAFVSESDT